MKKIQILFLLLDLIHAVYAFSRIFNISLSFRSDSRPALRSGLRSPFQFQMEENMHIVAKSMDYTVKKERKTFRIVVS